MSIKSATLMPLYFAFWQIVGKEARARARHPANQPGKTDGNDEYDSLRG
jgi:hypothetical protein